MGGWEPDAAVEHASVEGGEAPGVCGFGGGEVADGVGGEEPGEHGSLAVGGEGDSGFSCCCGDAVGDGGGGLVDLGVDGFAVLLEVGEGGDAGGHGEGVSAEGSGLVDGAERGELVHDFGAAAEGSDGESSADDFAQGREVGADLGELLHAAEGDAEAGHNFVEDEERAFAGGDVAEGLEVAGLGQDAAHVSGDGFDDDAGDFVFVGGEGGFNGGGVVVGQGEGELGDLVGDAGGAGDAEGGEAGAGFGEESVGVAVIAALEFDDVVAAGEGAGEAQGRHGGFGSGGDEAEFFNGGDGAGDELGEVGFGGGGGAETGAGGGGLLDGLDDGREGVSEDHGSPGAEVVEVLVAVGVVEVCAFGAGKEGRLAADGAEGSDGGVYSAGEEALGALAELIGPGEVERAGGGVHGFQYMSPQLSVVSPQSPVVSSQLPVLSCG